LIVYTFAICPQGIQFGFDFVQFVFHLRERRFGTQLSKALLDCLHLLFLDIEFGRNIPQSDLATSCQIRLELLQDLSLLIQFLDRLQKRPVMADVEPEEIEMRKPVRRCLAFHRHRREYIGKSGFLISHKQAHQAAKTGESARLTGKENVAKKMCRLLQGAESNRLSISHDCWLIVANDRTTNLNRM